MVKSKLARLRLLQYGVNVGEVTRERWAGNDEDWKEGSVLPWKAMLDLWWACFEQCEGPHMPKVSSGASQGTEGEIPSWVGTDQRRRYEFSDAGELVLLNTASGADYRLVWQRDDR